MSPVLNMPFLGPESALSWVVFNCLIILLILVDLLVFKRSGRDVNIKEALWWSLGWVLLALAFNVFIYFWLGEGPAIKFLTGYLIEKSLSVDNLFVFVLIFSSFNIPSQHQSKILSWGIIAALIMRAIFIFAGVSLLARFSFLIYVMGAFLVFSGTKLLLFAGEEKKEGFFLRVFSKFKAPSEDDSSGAFILKKNGWWKFTRFFYVLILVDIVDLVFAIDSIPAILAITNDPFIIYTSNAFAILGLRALYFALSGLIKLFRFLDNGISIILILVGLKMIAHDFYHPPEWLMLTCIVTILTSSIVISILKPAK